jgi:hypothetical protein
MMERYQAVWCVQDRDDEHEAEYASKVCGTLAEAKKVAVEKGGDDGWAQVTVERKRDNAGWWREVQRLQWEPGEPADYWEPVV